MHMCLHVLPMGGIRRFRPHSFPGVRWSGHAAPYLGSLDVLILLFIRSVTVFLRCPSPAFSGGVIAPEHLERDAQHFHRSIHIVCTSLVVITQDFPGLCEIDGCLLPRCAGSHTGFCSLAFICFDLTSHICVTIVLRVVSAPSTRLEEHLVFYL